jgi:hypothetical protein
MNLSDKVLKKIEKKNITPKPRWIFTLQNVAVWFSSILFLLIGGLAFSVVIYMILESDWSLYANLNDSLWKFVILILPYFWLVILILLVVLANYNLKNTKGGYRYQLRTIVILVLLISLLLGGVFYLLGLGKKIDETFAEKMPIYERFINKINRDKGMWMKPGRGLLAGVITSFEDGVMRISDFNNDVWVIRIDDKTVFRGIEADINHGIKMIGTELLELDALAEGERIFQADFVDVLPNLDWFRHHPRGVKRIITMREGDRGIVSAPESFMHMEYDENVNLEHECRFKEDCTTPFPFMIRSDCPFESECINHDCRVVCSKPWENQAEEVTKEKQCSYNKECSCDYYQGSDLEDCICFENRCMVLVD